MATIVRQAIEIKTPEKGAFMRYTENASQAAKRGEFVTLSTGKVSALSGTDPGANTIAGIAVADFENVAAPANRGAVIFIPEADCMFEVTMAGVAAQADVGSLFESLEAADIVMVDRAASVTNRWQVMEIVERQGQAVGDTDVRVYAKLAVGGLQLSGR